MNLAALPVATLIIIIIAIVGAAIVIIHPETLSFGNYVKYISVAAGLLGIGRGLDSTHKP